MSRRIKQTSIDAYHKILASGRLAESRAEVLRHFIAIHPGTMTGAEADRRINPNAHKRLSELVGMGLLAELGNRRCNVTNEVVTEWGLTDNPILRNVSPARKIIRETVMVSNCSECLMRDTDNTCMGADVVGNCPKTGRPTNCPLFEKIFVIRSF